MILVDAEGSEVARDLDEQTADVIEVAGVPYRFEGIEGASGQRQYRAIEGGAESAP